MPEYIYLLETRLSAAQKNALANVRDAAREAGMTVFLAGGAVRDLTTGSSVRDLDFSIQGNALDLEAAIVARGGTLWGRHQPSRTLFFWFPGSVRVEVVSTRQEKFPKPGEPVYSWSGIVDDLHRRDFTANAMALSLNEGSYGLLLDPLNGIADIEARQLRLVSNYGFLEDPSRLVRAVRLRHRLGWQLEERTAIRYENAKEVDNFDVISPFLRGYELEKIAAEDEALATLKALEVEGWLGKLAPGWTSASVDTAALEDLHRNRIQLLMQDVSPDLSAAHLEVLTAKMSAKDRDQLKKMMVRPGLLAQWEGLDGAAKEFARLLTGKEAALPSATWKLFRSHAAEPILWLAHTRKGVPVEAKFKNFFSVWPEAAKKVPVALMLEMRITPELAIYPELLRELFLQQIDGNLETEEQMRAFLETYSPPAPPPPVTLRRSRTKKADGKSKRKEAARDEDDDDLDDERPKKRSGDDDGDLDLGEEDLDDEDEDEKPGKPEVDELGVGRKLNLDKIDLGAVLDRIQSTSDDEDEDDDEGRELNLGESAAPDAGEDTDAAEDDDAELDLKPSKRAQPPVKQAATGTQAGTQAGKPTGKPTAKQAAPVSPVASAPVALTSPASGSKAAAKPALPALAAPRADAEPAKKSPPAKTILAKPAPRSPAATPVKAVTAKAAIKADTKTPAKQAPAMPPVKKAAAPGKKAVPKKAPLASRSRSTSPPATVKKVVKAPAKAAKKAAAKPALKATPKTAPKSAPKTTVKTIAKTTAKTAKPVKKR